MKLDLGTPTRLWGPYGSGPTAFQFDTLRYEFACDLRKPLKHAISARLYASLGTYLELRSPYRALLRGGYEI